MLVAFGRQAIVILGRGQLDGFQRRFRRGAADDERHVVRRASRGAQRAHLVDQVVFQFARRQQRLGFLIQIGFVGGTAALGDAQELVLFAVHAVEIDLRRQIAAGVDLFVHIQRGVLRIAQVLFDVGVVHPARQRFFIAAAGPDALALFADDNRRAGVWQVGKIPLAAISELRRNCSATYLSFSLASGSLRISATCCWCAGRSMNDASWNACWASRVNASGATFRISAFEFAHGNVVAAQQVVFGIVFLQRERILIVERFIRH